MFATCWFVGLLSLCPSSQVELTPGFFWSGWFGAAPRVPMLADVDGDRFADLIVADPRGASWLGLCRNLSGEKPRGGETALDSWAGPARAFARIRYTRPDRDEIAGLFDSGELRVATGFDGHRFTAQRTLPWAAEVPPGGPELLTAYRTRNRCTESLLHWSGTRLFEHRDGEEGPVEWILPPDLPAPLAIAATDLDLDGDDELVLRTADRLVICFVRSGRVVAREERGDLPLDPSIPFCVGRFGPERDGRGHARGGVLLGDRWIRLDDGHLVESTWPTLTEHRRDVLLAAGDLTGDGRDDVARCALRTTDPWPPDPVHVHFTFERDEPDWVHSGLSNEERLRLGADPLARSTSGDGLLDGWKVHGVRGLDLAALGCDVRHHDVVVLVQRFADVDEATLRAGIERAQRLFRELPVENRDGTTGIHLHVVEAPPIPLEQAAGKNWPQNAAECFDRDLVGVAHWMQVTNGGGGQSSEWGNAGSCGLSAFWLTFSHELGHQLGLSHNPGWQVFGCPSYPSIMNYCYSYQLAGSSEHCSFSKGLLTKIVLDERDLDERLPLPLADVSFLGQGPYSFRLEDHGAETWIDWNWNGVFGERHVRADVNYAYCTSAGVRQFFEHTHCDPEVVSFEDDECLLFLGTASDPLPDPVPAGTPHSLCEARPGSLSMRRHRGGERWDEAVVIEPEGVVGSPSAVETPKGVLLCTPTHAGVNVRTLTIDRTADHWTVGEARIVPGSAGRQPTAAVLGDRVFVLLRDPASGEVAVVELREGDSAEPSAPLFTSTLVPGTCVDTIRGELVVGLAQDQDEHRKSRWQVRRFVFDDTAGALREVGREWVEGEGGSASTYGRCHLLFDRSADAGPAGRLRYYGGGGRTDEEATGAYVSLAIADRSVRGGWHTRRIYDEWTNSRSGPAVTWYRGDILFASRWIGAAYQPDDDQLFVAYQGLGLDELPMGDHDDVGFLARFGLERSVHWFETNGPAAAVTPGE